MEFILRHPAAARCASMLFAIGLLPLGVLAVPQRPGGTLSHQHASGRSGLDLVDQRLAQGAGLEVGDCGGGDGCQRLGGQEGAAAGAKWQQEQVREWQVAQGERVLLQLL